MPITELRSTRQLRSLRVSRTCISECRGSGRGAALGLRSGIRLYLLSVSPSRRGTKISCGGRLRRRRRRGGLASGEGHTGPLPHVPAPDSEALTSEGDALAPGQRTRGMAPASHYDKPPACPALPLCSACPFDEVTNQTVSSPGGEQACGGGAVSEAAGPGLVCEGGDLDGSDSGRRCGRARGHRLGHVPPLSRSGSAWAASPQSPSCPWWGLTAGTTVP